MRIRSSAPIGWLSRWLALSALSYNLASAAITFEQAPQPDLDLSQLGRVALVGDFESISLYQYIGQGQNSEFASGSQALLTRFPNGLFNALTSADGNIQSICSYSNAGQYKGIVVGGNFTSLGGIKAPGIALYDPESDAITPITGISGRVDSLFCDPDSSTVYVGGTFLANQSSNAMAWDGDWKHLPFQGFNGPVQTITKTSSGDILFGGSFTSLGTTTQLNSSTSTNDTVKLRQVSLGSANIWSSTDKSTWTSNSDPRSLICNNGDDANGKSWFGPDDGPASFWSQFQFSFTPTKLRLWNTNLDDHGTKSFRFNAFPINGIMNFTYVDAHTGVTMTCDATCPLPQGNTTYQDFTFVNQVEMNEFRLDLNEWYGKGPGLSGIELFQSQIDEYAVSNFNQPTCSNGTLVSPESNTTGDWTLSNVVTSAQYLTAYVSDATINPTALSVTIQPDITQAGNYSVLIFTPGCIADGSCATRGLVTVTATFLSEAGSQPLVADVWQTNNFDKYDRIFFSFIDAPKGSFKPFVTIQPATGQTGPKTFVAQSLHFDLESADAVLNGIFDYDVGNTNFITSDLSSSVYNKAGQNLAPGAEVHALSTGDITFAAGNFTAAGISNVMGIDSTGSFGLTNGGLDDETFAIYRDDTYAYFGGAFQSTFDKSTALSHVSRYDPTTKTWSQLGGGVNGVVQYLTPISVNVSSSETVAGIAVSGDFDSVLPFGSYAAVSVASIAVWLPSKNAWLVNVNQDAIALSGRLTATANLPDGNVLYAGDVSSQALDAGGAVGLRPTTPISLERLQFSMSPSTASSTASNSTSSNSTLTRRAQIPLTSTPQVQGAVTGLMYSENALNITIFGGHFVAKDSKNDTINNVLFVNSTAGDTISGLPSGISSASVVRALGTHDTTLYIGGDLTGTINGNPVRGMVVYDLRSAKFASTQPPSLAGEDSIVYAITPDTSGDIYVGGLFDGAGSFTCPAMCVYSSDRAQWQSPGGNMNGTVSVFSWIDQSNFLVGGNYSVQGEAATIRTYNTVTRAFTSVAGGEAPGHVTAITPSTADSSGFFAAGTTTNGDTFLALNNGNSWTSVDGFNASTSVIKGLQVFTTTKNHDNSNLLGSNRALLVLGSIDLPGVGSVSAALFNGTAFTPFSLTSSSTPGKAGSLSQTFVQNPQNFFTSNKKHLAVGFVVLIGLAIALVLTCLLIVAAILTDVYRRSQEGYVPMSSGKLQFREDAMTRIPPEHLFNGVGKPNPEYTV